MSRCKRTDDEKPKSAVAEPLLAALKIKYRHENQHKKLYIYSKFRKTASNNKDIIKDSSTTNQNEAPTASGLFVLNSVRKMRPKSWVKVEKVNWNV